MARERKTGKPATKAKPIAQTEQTTVSPTKAVHRPVVASNVVDTLERDEPKVTATTRFDQAGERHDDESEIELETGKGNLDQKARDLAFLEEPVTIEIHTSSDKNAEKLVFCGVNGRGPGPGGLPYIPRGKPVDVARKYVEVLASAKDERVKNEEKVNPETGEKYIEYPRMSSLKYPFSIIRDDNPRGRQWLQSVLARRA